jgi:hypothetical protein
VAESKELIDRVLTMEREPLQIQSFEILKDVLEHDLEDYTPFPRMSLGTLELFPKEGEMQRSEIASSVFDVRQPCSSLSDLVNKCLFHPTVRNKLEENGYTPSTTKPTSSDPRMEALAMAKKHIEHGNDDVVQFLHKKIGGNNAPTEPARKLYDE